MVNLHVQAIDQSDAIKTVKRKITDLDAMKIQEQKRADVYKRQVLFNAPSTINGYYTALVAHDMNTGSWGTPQNR